MKFEEQSELFKAGIGILTATKKGTRQYGQYCEYRSPDGLTVFRGRPLIAPGIILLEHYDPNTIVTVGKAHVGNMLIDESGYDTGFTYCALGSDNTAPAVGQTQLVNEGGGAAMRNTITTKLRSGNVITMSTFFTAAQSTLAIKEVAIFGHSTAGASENSGIMFARWLSDIDNSAPTYDLTFDYVLTIG